MFHCQWHALRLLFVLCIIFYHFSWKWMDFFSVWNAIIIHNIWFSHLLIGVFVHFFCGQCCILNTTLRAQVFCVEYWNKFSQNYTMVNGHRVRRRFFDFLFLVRKSESKKWVRWSATKQNAVKNIEKAVSQFKVNK